MPDRHRSLATAAVHAGEPDPRIDGAVAMPIFQTSTYVYGGESTYDSSRYVRISNSPNRVWPWASAARSLPMASRWQHCSRRLPPAAS